MQFPPKDAKILAWADPRRSFRYEGANDEELFPEYEYEGVYYPRTNSLGMQWHPEMMNKQSAGYLYTQRLISKFLKSQL
jgi:hypothetical protein